MRRIFSVYVNPGNDANLKRATTGGLPLQNEKSKLKLFVNFGVFCGQLLYKAKIRSALP